MDWNLQPKQNDSKGATGRVFICSHQNARHLHLSTFDGPFLLPMVRMQDFVADVFYDCIRIYFLMN